MKRFLMYAFLLMSSSPAFAVDESPLATALTRLKQSTRGCTGKAVGVAGSEECYARGLKSAEDLLNRTYQQRLATYGSISIEGGDVARRFKDGQRAWILYRDAHCSFANAALTLEFEAEGVTKSLCPYAETIRRLSALDDLTRIP